MKLIGSIASPYVRRIRLLLQDRDYEFQIVNIFSKEGQMAISQYTPTLRIPILVDGSKAIWDSLLITEYLKQSSLDLEIKKELTLINEMTDAGIQLYQLRKFEVDSKDNSIFSKNNLNRIQKVLNYFEKRDNSKWDLITQWLYCTLDWFSFRNVHEWTKKYPRLLTLYKEHSSQIEIMQTDPRN